MGHAGWLTVRVDEASPAHVVAALLAAGGSSRFEGGPKQLADLRGRTLVERAVEAALDAGVFEVVFVVTGAVDLGGVLGPDVVLVENPRWAEGQATSLDVARRAAQVAGADALVVGLADQPFVGPEAWRAVALAPDDHPIVVATYQGRRGNPVRLAREVWSLLPTAGDEGARALMRERPELVGAVACSGDATDIDTVEDLARWS